MTSVRQAYAEEGIPIFPKTEEFLSNFNGLIIEYTDPSFKRKEWLSFYAQDSVCGMGPFYDREGLKFNMIGSCWGDSELAMDEAGKTWIFTIAAPPVIFAESIEKTIDLLLTGTDEEMKGIISRIWDNYDK